jgi:protein SMG6
LVRHKKGVLMSSIIISSLFFLSHPQYEVSQRKRDEKNRSKLKEKEHRFDGNLRKETWIHPEGGRRVHRTAILDPSVDTSNDGGESSDEELQDMDPSELNKRFVISFLHVQGKLINKIG